VLAMYPQYVDINELMDAMGWTPQDVMNMGRETDAGNLEEAADTVEQMDAAQQAIIDPASGQKTFSGEKEVKTAFNLKKSQLVPGIGVSDTGVDPEIRGDQLQVQDELMQEQHNTEPPFKSHVELMLWLDKNDFETIMQVLRTNDVDVKEELETYKSMMEPEERADFAQKLFDILPSPSLKDEGGTYMSQEKRVTHGSFDDVNNDIKKMAQDHVQKTEQKPFNMKKYAQHKTLDNAIVWGPGQTRIDPFLHQPVSDWHIVERNKGFGLVVDDVWNIDYETIWRNNVMDKYYRPYRDTKTGEWVGGYIQKRFEVDKNIPESSNLQLKPGQKRRPIVPEHGNTESRLQAARAAGEIEGAIDTSKPFNWKEAKSKKKR
jgi:hypothetical protein